MHRPRARSFGLSILILAVLTVLAVTLPQACAQNVNGRYDNFAWTATTIAGQQTFTSVPYASVQVCNYPANAVPCTNLITLYLGPTSTGGTAPNPTSSDLYGNFGFWAAPGTYQYTLTTSTGQSVGPYSLVLGTGSGGGGGGSPGGALFSIQYNNSTFAGASISGLVKASTSGAPTAAVANSDYLLPTGPGTGLTGIPYLTANTFSGNQTAPQFIAQTSITTPIITVSGLSPGNCVQAGSGGILTTSSSACASSSGGATTPATTNLLKGNGAVNGVLAAVPNTDYTTPSGSITGTAANLSGTPTLPNGVSGTTQTATDTSTLLATDSFVHTVAASQAAVSIPSTANILKGAGSAGTSLASLFTDNATTGGYTGTGGFSAKSFNSTDTVNNTSVSFQTGSGGDSTCPTPVSGTSYICTKSSGISISINGASYTAIGSGSGTPGGSNTQVQVNGSGSFAGYAGFTYNNSTQTMDVGPLGTANSGANFNSGILETCASTWTGSAALPDCWQLQVQPDPGTNPFSEFHLTHAGSSGGGQVVLPLTQFTAGIELNSLNTTGSMNLQGPTNMPGGSYTAIMPGSAPAGSASFLSCPFLSGTNYQCLWTTGGGGGSAFVTPQQFGGFGDAYAQPDGCATTASNTTINCRDATFVSGDVGKQIWVPGAGAAGVSYHGSIVSVTDASDVVVTPAPSTTVGYGVLQAVYGHDDTVAVQSCMQYSANNGVQCVLAPLAIPAGGNFGYAGFLIGSSPGLTLPVNNLGASANVTGSTYTTNLFCEFNGDCISLAAGAVQSAIVSNLALIMDATQASSRAFHFNATAGPFGTGGLWNSTFTNIVVNNAPNECMWMDGGGGPGYTFLLPNQIDTFIQFQCNGANQSHPASLIKLTGQAAQILFENGQTNGASVSDYPNAQIEIDQGQVGWDVAPVDVKFIGYTMEVGQKGLLATDASNNIHFDNGYLEDITLVGFTLTNSPGFTFNGNHIASTAYGGGAIGIGNLTGGSTASIRDNWVYGNTPASLAVCSGSNNSIDFAGDVVQAEPTNLLTTNCATATATSASGNLTIGQGAVTASITCVGGAVVNLNAPGVQPGKTLTLYAPASGCQLGSGGDIAMGNYTSPITLPAGGTATLTLLDNGVTFLVTDAPPNSPSPNWSTIVHGANTDAGAFGTLGAWTFNGNVYQNSSSGATNIQMGPGALPSTGGSTCMYDDGNFHFDATCNGNRGLFFSGNFSSQYIAGFRPTVGGTVVLKVGMDGSLISTGSLTLAAARKGTFTCTAGGTITIANTNELATSDVVISLNAQAGVISTVPAMNAVTGGTGFTVLCGAADTSVYNYDILN